MKTIIIALCLAASFAFAQKEAPPDGSAPKDFTLPKKHIVTFKNGLEAVFVPYGRVPKVNINVVVRVGNINERPGQTGLADIMGDLMKEGTTTRTAEQIAAEAASMGGSLNVGIGVDQSSIGGEVLSEFGPRMAALAADVVRNPLFPESELPRLKNNTLREITVAKSSPQQLTFEKFRSLLYGDHPYGTVFPTEEAVKGYTAADVRKFYKENVGAARTRIYVAGVFDQAAMEKALRDAFESWPKGPAVHTNVPKPKAKKQFHLIDRPGAAQSTIYLGLPTLNNFDPDYVKMIVTNSLLGGSFGSRITANIREQKGYTYSPNSQLSTRYRDGYWVQTADVTSSVTGASLKEITYEIDRLRSEAPSDAEVGAIRNYIAGVFVLQNSSRGGIIGQLSSLKLHGLPDSYLANYVKNVHATTPADVQAMAKKYIRPEEMTLVITGDKTSVEKQIEEFAKGVPIEKK